jgi:hypothetical protein
MESYRFLRMIGNQSNTANLVSLTQDFPDFVKGMRQQMKDLQEQCTKRKTKNKEKLVLMRRLKEDLASSTGITMGHVGQVFQLAKVGQEVWQHLWPVLIGDYVGPKQSKAIINGKRKKHKAPARLQSASHLIQWSSFSPALQKRLLLLVTTGKMTVQQLAAEGKMIKARNRLRLAITDFLERRGYVDFHTDYDEAEYLQRTICEDEEPRWNFVLDQLPMLEERVVQPWATTVTKMKKSEEIPTQVLTAVETLYLNQKQQKVSCFCSLLDCAVHVLADYLATLDCRRKRRSWSRPAPSRLWATREWRWRYTAATRRTLRALSNAVPTVCSSSLCLLTLAFCRVSHLTVLPLLCTLV